MAFVPAHMLDPSPGDWIVNGVIPDEGIGFAYGPSKSYKSAVIFKMALDIVNGQQFFGHETVKGDVAMALGEGAPGAGKRVMGLLADSVHEQPAAECAGNCKEGACACTVKVHLTDEGLWLFTEPFSMVSPAEVGAVITALRRLGDDLRIVILDAASDFIGNGGGIEFPSPASRFIAGMKRISRELSCFVLAVHHTGYDESHMRGAKRLFDASDVVIKIMHDGEDGTVTCEKQKEGEEFAPMAFTAHIARWADPETGKPVSAVVAREQETEELPLRLAPKERVIPRVSVDVTRKKPKNGIRQGNPVTASVWSAVIILLIIVGIATRKDVWPGNASTGRMAPVVITTTAR